MGNRRQSKRRAKECLRGPRRGGHRPFLIVLGLSARAWSGLILVDPGDLHEKWLHLPPAEFKREALYSAGKNFDANSRTVNRKSLIASLMVMLLVIEAGLFVAWFAST